MWGWPKAPWFWVLGSLGFGAKGLGPGLDKKSQTNIFVQVVATLGVGGFGRVELVKCRKKPGVTYALKCLKKQHIVETQQQEHVFSEKNILMSCRHIFITK